MKPNWKKCDEIVECVMISISEFFGRGIDEKTPARRIILIFRARIEVTADFDGMLGKRGFHYRKHTSEYWIELDGNEKTTLREGEYKYIDDGVY